MVAAAPTLTEATLKKPLLLSNSITPLPLDVTASAIRSGTAAEVADSSSVLRPTKLGALRPPAQRKSRATSVAENSSLGVMPNTKDCVVPAGISTAWLASPIPSLVDESVIR